MALHTHTVTAFFGGDVMTGRGVDQILAHAGDPALHEPAIRDARDYVALAERAHGPIARPVPPAYPWGDTIDLLAAWRPDVRIVNLETSVTRSDRWCREKEIHYRMHPDNIACLVAGGIDIAVLANNHVLDWGEEGLLETLRSLAAAGIRTAGAGTDLAAARAPAMVEVGGGARIVVRALGSPTSGIPENWAAAPDRPGLAVEEISARTADAVSRQVAGTKRVGDVAVVSVHWGTNWGYDVPEHFVQFAHRLIDGGIDVVHGHSSHHVRPIEVYRDRLVLYGCGDLLTDYEGIRGHERFRGDLGLLLFATVEAATGRLRGLSMVPVQSRRLSLRRAADHDVEWLRSTLSRWSRRFNCGVVGADDGSLRLAW